ncbi:MAG: amino acid adenylation domain-containing protein [Gemmatimonadota bacterium]
MVGDGWSTGVLVREVSALYAAFSRGETPRLPELPVQYADYAVWQREWLSGKTLEEQIGWWKQKLAGAPPLLQIPTDCARVPGQSPHVAGHALRLSPELSRELRALSQREGVTPFMTLLATWQLLLARYAGQDDLVVGTPVAGRSRRETEGLIGFFVNMLCLRGRLSGDPTWSELLGRVREEALGAYAHQELPFERLVEELHVERSLTHSPVFQTSFALHLSGGDDERLQLGDLELEPFGRGGAVARYDLDLVMADAGDALAGELAYRVALFDAGTVGRMAGHLRVLLEALAADPRRRVREVSLLTGAERAQVVEGWNATAAAYPRGRCIHELVRERAALAPGAVAVTAGGRSLTYAGLERRSGRLARRLSALGVRPETRVGLCLERGPGMVTALLGTLEAGGAYLPLDPAYPAERLAYMLQDSGASMLLTQAHLADRFTGFGGEVVLVGGDAEDDEDDAEDDAEDARHDERAASPENLAYVIYTSGSTGRPKGVAVPHRAVVNFLESMRARPGLTPADTLLAVTTLSFDIAALELLLPLVTGARVVVADRETATDGVRLREALAASGATVMQATPASWRMLLEAGWEGTPGLKALCGGEALPRDLAERVAARCAGLWNLYGPTETTIWSTLERVEPGAGAVPIGGPIANTRVYLLDGGGEPVPCGVAAELCIGGHGVARGYLGRPELTAVRFVPDAHSGEPGARLYRTGDRARRRADGKLEYLGRSDHQVKVRGFRIELGEVEAALRAQPGVSEAVAVVREDAPGDRRLVAYVVAAEGGSAPTAAELRAGLRRRLPEHMVPGAFVPLESIPLTASGKIDRRALPAPERGPAGAYVAPRTPAEEVLSGIWAEVLGSGRVGVEDGFFELGGHSLLATRVVSRARQAFGIEVPLRALFEAPTVAALAERIDSLRGEGGPPAPPVERAPRTGPLPLSFAQQRLWLVDRLEPGSPAYNMPYALRLRGTLNVRALRAGLDELARRHETLRTTFAKGDGDPVQVVHPPARVPLPTLDLGALPEARREPEARRLAGGEALRPFDLARGPLLRGTLLRLGGDDHVLLFTLHHVVSDGWSMEVLVREVSTLYEAFGRGEPSPLPELPVQYADFALWQRGRLSGEALEAQVGWWRERLAGAPPLLEIPTDRPRTAGRSPVAASHHFSLPAEVSRGLRELSRREGATLFMTLLAGWHALLSRYSGQEDVVVGSPIAGRTRRETEGLIGFFVNMVALRGDLSGDPTWAELLGRTREAALGAYDHLEVPFERLVEELAVERSLTHTPVFQATFALDRAGGPDRRPALGGLALEPFAAGVEAARFDLGLTVQDTEEGLGARLLYRAALFEPETVARMAAQLEVLLGAMAAGPETRLRAAPLLRGAEREQVLEGWSAAAAEPPSGGPVHRLFEAWAARTPDAPALADEERTLGYAELDRAANQLAHALLRRGAGPEARVGVLLDRSAGLVVALLAVLKSGAAYVPLDPSTPPERLALVLEDAGVSVLLLDGGAAAAPPRTRAALLRLDADAAEIAAERDASPGVEVAAESAAYVIYTSGSTGTPKGVVVEHRHLAAYVHAIVARLGLRGGMRHALASTVAADLGNTVLYPALCTGGVLHVLSRETATSGERFAAAMRGHRIDVLKIVPSHLAALLQGPGGAPGLPRRLLVLGGEASRAEWVRGLMERAPEMAVANHYGPTEATVGVLTHRVRGTERGATVPLGRPLDGTRVYVLDRWGDAVPAGVPGELYVGGAQVARGYAGRPARTAESFVPDGFSREPGARLYRTGDRVRWLPTGELEFLGRVDDQVKIRGFRVEPGEVEAALRAHPGVRAAAVAAREDAPGRKHLVAYVVPAKGARVAAAGLRAHLSVLLPEYMVPGAFVALESIPLTANGKVDRGALPAPERGADGEHAAPRTPAEEVLAVIWAEVLGLERVGTDQGFFELGGHSLLAMQVVSRVRQAFGTEVPLRALFEAPTVATLAERIELLRGPGAASAPPIVRVARGAPLPLSFAQQRLWLVDRLEPGSPAYNMPYALRLRGALDAGALRAGLDELVRRHEALRTTFAEGDGAPVQVIHPPARVPLPTLDLGALPESLREPTAERLAREEALRPFDLARGPLLRSTLLRLAGDDHVLLFTLHHVVSDGWSMRVLVREVSALYTAFTRGEAPPLPELPVQYADFAVWQRARHRGEALEAQIGWWKERLAGASPLLEIPTDRPRTAGQSPLAGSHALSLPAEVSRGLRELSRREGATLFMTLLAGWHALLSRYSGQEDVVVGSPIAGRARRETEGLIGFFVNMLALRGDLSGDPTWAELLGRTREAALGAYDHQEVPFERLVEELAVERSLLHAPLFQAAFALNLPEGDGERPEMGGLAAAPLGGGMRVVKFDLDLVLADTGETVGGVLTYRSALFDPATVTRLAGHLEATLEAVAAGPGRRLSELSLLRGPERRQLLEAGTGVAAGLPRGCLHELFAAQAARTPAAVAVATDAREVTYGELERAARRLAHRLRALGVGPEVCVGVGMERGVELVVALLGTLGAGGVYLPLDPAHPPERLAYMLADSGASVLLAPASLQEALPSFRGARLCPDEVAADVPDGAPWSGVDPLGAAYVIYTSGSTGTPKGVVVSHRSAAGLLERAVEAFGAGPGSRVLQAASPGFDVSLLEIFVALLSGAALHVAGRDVVLAPERLGALLREREIDVWASTPALLDSLPDADFPALRAVSTGGERCSAETAARWSAGRRLVNMYGPTETTIYTTAHVCAPGLAEAPPIGRPVADARVYVLDPRGEPAPTGVPGELYVGGAGVARGYHGRPGLTAERFVPDALSPEPGARLYRTGDRVRWRADGELEFLGRLDEQVKIRGFRIEPGEIEAVLLEQAGVREAVVLAREDAPGGRRLVAYVVPEEGAQPSAAELRASLAARLPEHMVPSGLVALDRLPLSANGKVDRRALLALSPVGGREYAAPETAMEELLCGIWLDVLGSGGARHERVGIHDSFFELGGHSLLATQVVTRISRELGIDVPLQALFESPTVAALATRVEDLYIMALDASEFEERVSRLEVAGGTELGE